MHFDPDSILELDAKLRRLARALIADAAKADDVVQRAWVAAVSRRDDATSMRSLLPWLRGAVRKLALLQFREDSRRTRRESGMKPPEASWSAPEIVEREAVRRSVLNAVVGLAEPYRETLLLRYYEGLTTREIARRMNSPINSVTSRLQRGLALVRAQLEEGDDSRSSMLALIPFAASGPPLSLTVSSSLALKVIAMNMKAKVAIAACVLVITSAFVFQAITSPGPAASTISPGPNSNALVPPNVADETKANAPALVREETKSPGPETAPLADSKTGGLLLHVVYESDGAPAAGVMLSALCSGDANPYAGTRRIATDQKGDARLDPLPAGRVMIQCALGQAQLRVPIVAGETAQATLRLPPGGLVTGVVLDSQRNPVAGAGIFLTGMVYSGFGAGAIVTTSDASGRFSIRDVNEIQYVGARLPGRSPSPLQQVFTAAGQTVELELVLGTSGGALEGDVTAIEGAPIAGASVMLDPRTDFSFGFQKEMACVPYQAATDAAGRFRIADLPAGTFELKVWAKGRAVETRAVEIVAGGVARVAVRLRLGGKLVGTVKNGSRAPVAGAEIHSANYSSSVGEFFARSDANGAFAIDSMPLGEIEVFVDADEGKEQRKLVFASGQETRFDAILGKGLSIRGHVVDDLGAPMREISIMATAIGLPGMGGATTDASGAFEIANLGPGRFDLSVYPKGGDDIPTHVEHSIEAGSNAVVIRLSAASLPSVYLVGKVVGPGGDPAVGAEIDFKRTGTKGGSGIRWTDAKTGAFKCGPVPPGEYAVHVRATGFAELRSATKTGGQNETIDFGVLTLASGQILKIHFVRPLPLADARAFVQISDGSLDTFLGWEQDGANNLDAKSLPLPPGNYRVLVSGKGIARTYADVVIKAGSDASLEMTLVPSLDRVVRIVEKTATNELDLPIRVFDEKGVMILGRSVSRDVAASPFVLRLGLAPGKYSLVADPGGPRETRVEFGVSEGDAPEICVELP